jgi:hypothetical protein
VQVLEEMAGKVEILQSRVGLECPSRESGEEGVGHQRGRKSPINLHSIAWPNKMNQIRSNLITNLFLFFFFFDIIFGSGA